MHREIPRIRTENIPQANSLESLRAVVEAVANGAYTTSDIEAAAELSRRHVRYYLLAAQTLGWIELGSVRPFLTDKGRNLLTLEAVSLDESDAIAFAILESDILKTAVGSFLTEVNTNRSKITERLLASTNLSRATAERRASCLIRWRAQLLNRNWNPERMANAVNATTKELPLDNLSVRAYRVLQRLGVESVGDLALLTVYDVQQTWDCGRRTLREITAWAKALGMPLRGSIANVPGSVTRTITSTRSDDSSKGLETEVATAIFAVVKAADRPKVELWIGLDQTVPPTLQEIGDVAYVTRERIRQVLLRVRRQLAVANLEMSVLRRAVKRLEKAGVLSERRAVAILRKEKLTARRVSVRGLLRAADLFGVKTKLNWEWYGDSGFVGLPKGLAILKSISRIARRAVKRWGCSTLEDVAAETAGERKIAVTADNVRDVLITQPGFRWLDEGSGWFWLDDVPRNRLLNKIDKILAAAKRVDLAALRAGVARHYRMEGFSPPIRILRELCEQLEDCEVVGGQIVVDRRPRLPTEELSDCEQKILEVFREHGPALSYGNVHQRCIEAGLNEATTSTYLGNTPILRRVAVGVYTVVGAAVNPGQINAVAKEKKGARRSRVIHDFGWSPDGRSLWAIYKISKGAFRRGVFGVPGGIKKYLTEARYELRGSDGAEIGHIGIRDGRLWGFLPFFVRRGGEPGDFMRVTFNLLNNTAMIELSEEPFDEAERKSV